MVIDGRFDEERPIKVLGNDGSDTRFVLERCSSEAEEVETVNIPLRWGLPLPEKVKTRYRQLLIEGLLDCKDDLERYYLSKDTEKIASSIVKSWLLIKEIDTGFPMLKATLELDESERPSDAIILDKVKGMINEIDDVFETFKKNYGIDLTNLGWSTGISH